MSMRAEPITLFGADDCYDTQRTRQQLIQLGIPFNEIRIDDDPIATSFVTVVNGGYRSTPTLLIGQGKEKVVITEPTNPELVAILRQIGYDHVALTLPDTINSLQCSPEGL